MIALHLPMHSAQLQDTGEQEECVAALACLARSMEVTDLLQLQHMTVAFVHGVTCCQRSPPLEALCHVHLKALRGRGIGGDARDVVAQAIGFLNARLLTVIENMHPPAALSFILAATTSLSTAHGSESSEALLERAIAVYYRSCALPPHALKGFMALVRCGQHFHGLPQELHYIFTQKLARFALSLPARDQKVRSTSCISEAASLTRLSCTSRTEIANEPILPSVPSISSPNLAILEDALSMRFTDFGVGWPSR